MKKMPLANVRTFCNHKFLAALGAIHLMLKWLEKSTFTPFAIYRVILGIILLSLIYSGAI